MSVVAKKSVYYRSIGWHAAFLTILFTILLFGGCSESPEDLQEAARTWEASKSLLSGLKSYYNNSLKTKGRSLARTATIQWLRDQTGVRSASLSPDGSSILAIHDSGIRISYITRTGQAKGGTGGTGGSTGSTTKYLADGILEKALSGKSLAVYESPDFSSVDDEIGNLFSGNGYSVHKYQGENFTLDNLRNIDDYDVIYLSAHGGLKEDSSFYFMTGQKVNSRIEKWWNSLRYGVLGIGAHEFQINEKESADFYVVYSSFFKEETFKNESVLYASSCHSLQNTTLASKLVNNGLGAYIGWNDAVDYTQDDQYSNERLFKKLLSGMSLSAAFSAAEKEESHFGDSYYQDKETKNTIHATLGYYPSSAGGLTIKSAGADASISDAKPKDAGVPKDSKVDSNVVKPGTWKTVQSGTFQMGSPSSENCRESDEAQHKVTLTHNYQILATEVTQGEFLAVMGYNPSNFSSCGTTCPVENVNWHQAVAYANAVSKKSGLSACYTCTGSGKSVSCQEAAAYSGKNIYSCLGYRLPTEAEWEYAYRAGTTTAFYNGGITSCYHAKDPNLEKIGWYSCNANVTYSGCYNHTSSWCGSNCMGAQPVGLKQANAWGLYDMAGNVYEWCHDWYGDYPSSSVTDPVGASSGWVRVERGGSWYSGVRYARAAYRDDGHNPKYGDKDAGFRLVRSVP